MKCDSCGEDIEDSTFCDEYNPTPCPGSVSGQHKFYGDGFKGEHDDSPATKHPKSTEF